MKLSKSKLALAKVINDNGGWLYGADVAVQDRDSYVCFYSGRPTRDGDYWIKAADGGVCVGELLAGVLYPNWHQCVLSREEYYQAYPKADAGEWIEWKGGMKSPVESGVPVDVKTKGGYVHYDQLLGDACWRDNWGDANIISYRLHKPELVITDWRDLKVGDEVECVESNIQREKYNGMVGRLRTIDESDTSTPYLVDFGGEAKIWCHEVKFIRRP